jgi:hypothetical protein
MRVTTIHSAFALCIAASSWSLLLAQTALPNGAVALVNEDRHGSLVALCADTGDPTVQRDAKKIRATAVWAGAGANLKRLQTGIGACDPSWSPNGKHLALTAADGLWVFPANSPDGILRVESQVPLGSIGFNYRAFSRPRWSPDGMLVGLVVTNRGTSWIEVFDVNSGRLLYTSPPEHDTFTWTAARELKLGALEIRLFRR